MSEYKYCKYCGKEIKVKCRSIHLVCEHRIPPPDDWLKKHNLEREDWVGIIQEFVLYPNKKPDWIKEHFSQEK